MLSPNFMFIFWINSIGYVADTINPKNEDVEPEFHVLPIFLGAGFLYGVWYFLFRPKRLKQKQK